VLVGLERLDTALVDVIPHLDLAIVAARDEVGLVTARVISDTVHTLEMRFATLQREVTIGRGQTPDLDRLIERR